MAHDLDQKCVHALVSDGDLMEGVDSEAASLAGHLRRGKRVCLYDDHAVTLSAGTDITFSEDCRQCFDPVPDGGHTPHLDAATAWATSWGDP